MTNYARSDYGSNPLAGIDPNADHGWGGFGWPGGVPSQLLGTSSYSGSGRTSLTVLMRKELAPLAIYTIRIAWEKFGYVVYGSPNPSDEPTWGPWAYENRPIGGTQTASNHSEGKAMDWNAPWNPQSYTFQSTVPPGMIAIAAKLGWYSGVYYTGGSRYDPMHLEYVFAPGMVSGHISLAKQYLGISTAGGGSGGAIPITPTSIPRPKASTFYNTGKGWIKPAFPMHRPNYFGLVSGPKTSISGNAPSGIDRKYRSWIMLIQNYLTAIGFNPGPRDGIFGISTAAAVKKYQTLFRGSKGQRLSATGTVDSTTWNSMGIRVHR